MDKIDLIMARFDDLQADTTEIKEHLLTQNSRIRKVEVGVAVHWALWGLVGVVASAAVSSIMESIKWIW